MIAEHVWDGELEHLSQCHDVYIRYLRRNIEAGWPECHFYVRGSGYQLKEPNHE